jgi:hypothetical protein
MNLTKINGGFSESVYVYASGAEISYKGSFDMTKHHISVSSLKNRPRRNAPNAKTQPVPKSGPGSQNKTLYEAPVSLPALAAAYKPLVLKGGRHVQDCSW